MNVDVVIIGAGIAGTSLAAELAPHCSVALLEAEEMPGYHSTGRSAANWHETLGGPLVQPLTKISGDFLRANGFLHPRLTIEVAEAEGLPLLDALQTDFAGTGARLTRIDAAELRRLVPCASSVLVAGLIEEDCADIDVGALHGHYLGLFKRAGGTLLTDARVDRIDRVGDLWRAHAGANIVEAKTVVNAAGAWVDVIAGLAGVAPIGVEPMRRTIVQVRVDRDIPEDMPFVIDVAGTYYFRPEGPNRLWICPHDETPVEPHDVAPEELDVAIAVDRFETVTEWKVVAVERKWAGLRSFSPDRLPVYGFAPGAPGFFWCAGQGGFGIQTAPAAAQMCAHLILGDAVSLPDAINPQSFTPERFA